MTEIDYEKQKRAHKLCTQLAPYSWNNFAKSLIDFFNEKGFLTIKQIEAGEGMLKKASEKKWTQGEDPIPVMPIIGQSMDKTEPPISIEDEEEPF
tara:strand:- start:4588 stop:4872 length:285 start_codon:yes stop_codon:yes gene_type:complete